MLSSTKKSRIQILSSPTSSSSNVDVLTSISKKKTIPKAAESGTPDVSARKRTTSSRAGPPAPHFFVGL